jgi:ferredoxin
MARIRVIFESGEPERVIEFDPGDAPFQHDGEPGSILDVLLGHGVHLEHACGGNCACTTCHVIVRLGCQAVTEDPDVEIVVVVPRYTINQVSETVAKPQP